MLWYGVVPFYEERFPAAGQVEILVNGEFE